MAYELCRTSWKPEVFKFYTGLSPETFEILYQMLGGDSELNLKYHFLPNTPKKERESEHTKRDKMFMTLMRLRRGLPLVDLSLLFNLSAATLGTIFYS